MSSGPNQQSEWELWLGFFLGFYLCASSSFETMPEKYIAGGIIMVMSLIALGLTMWNNNVELRKYHKLRRKEQDK